MQSTSNVQLPEGDAHTYEDGGITNPNQYKPVHQAVSENDNSRLMGMQVVEENTCIDDDDDDDDAVVDGDLCPPNTTSYASRKRVRHQ